MKKEKSFSPPSCHPELVSGSLSNTKKNEMLSGTVTESQQVQHDKIRRLLLPALAGLAMTFLWSTSAFAATLNVSQVAHSGTVPKNGVRIPFLTVTATAVGGPVEISGVSVRRNGLSEDDDISRVIAITNGFKKSLAAGLSDGVATLSFRNPLVVPKGNSTEITVYGNIDMQFPAGRSIFFTLENIESDAESVIPVPIAEHPVRDSVPKLKKTRPAFRVVCEKRVCRKLPRE